MRGDVEDSTRFAVIEFVRHAFLNSTIAFDVDDIASFVNFEIGRERYNTALSESSRE